MKNNKARREDRRGRKEERKPPKTPTTHPPTVPPPVPPPSPPPVATGSYIVRIYDFTTRFSPCVKDAADYYRAFLSSHGVDIQYLRRDPLDGDACWSADNVLPQIGIRMCEKLEGPGTAGSTGAAWTQTSPSTWELSSSIMFEADNPELTGTCACNAPAVTTYGTVMAVHELGHSIGILDHNHNPDDCTCMSDSAPCWPDILTEAEKATVISRLPTGGVSMGLVSREVPSFMGCVFPPPTDS